MAQDAFFKKELVRELRYIEVMMKKDNSFEKKPNDFQAAYWHAEQDVTVYFFSGLSSCRPGASFHLPGPGAA